MEFFKNNFDNYPKLSCDLLIEAHRQIPMNCETTFKFSRKYSYTNEFGVQNAYEWFIKDLLASKDIKNPNYDKQCYLKLRNKYSDIKITHIKKLGKWDNYENLSLYNDDEKVVMARLFSGCLDFLCYTHRGLSEFSFSYIEDNCYFDFDNIDFGNIEFEDFIAQYKNTENMEIEKFDDIKNSLKRLIKYIDSQGFQSSSIMYPESAQPWIDVRSIVEKNKNQTPNEIDVMKVIRLLPNLNFEILMHQKTLNYVDLKYPGFAKKYNWLGNNPKYTIKNAYQIYNDIFN
jgi:hypothetical protein